MASQQQHFLVVSYPAQGHINPALRIAKLLARTTHLVTFSTAASGHRRMFPSSPDSQTHDALLTYVPYSDAHPDGVTDIFVLASPSYNDACTSSLSAAIDSLAARGTPVTCVIYSFILPWAARVARSHNLPAVLLWIQPATVLAAYHRHFHGHESLIAHNCKDPSLIASLPDLPPLRIRDLPSLLTVTFTPDHPFSVILPIIREAFLELDMGGARGKVLVHTARELESEAFSAMDGELDLFPVGPLLPATRKDDTADGVHGDLFRGDGEGYMKWLDAQTEKSVVYVCFGTVAELKRRQVEEVAKGLTESGRPYLWAMRRDGGGVVVEGGDRGMVVEWCAQGRVLSHPAVGCFLTHCGWNSTVEGVVCGVPMVAVPQFFDQPTAAWLVAEAWGTGVRAEVDGEGVVEGMEVRRCLEVVMGEGERGKEIRQRAAEWRETARVAVRGGGSSDLNLKAFTREMEKIKGQEVENLETLHGCAGYVEP